MQTESRTWNTSPLAAFVQHPPGDFNLHRDQPTDEWAAAGKFAFRKGNLAVGAKFGPAKNWSAGIIAQLALLVTEPQTDALVLPKPSTKTTHSPSPTTQRLAREPVAVAHNPNNLGDLVSLAFIVHWCLFWAYTPAHLAVMPAFPWGPRYRLCSRPAVVHGGTRCSGNKGPAGAFQPGLRY